MTLTNDRRELYPAMEESEVEAIDAAYDAAVAILKERDICVVGDDRAENLVGAIARFVHDCRPDPEPEADTGGIEIGRMYQFSYPADFRTLPDYTRHAGEFVRVRRAAVDGTEYDGPETDPEAGELAFHVVAADGWEGMAYASELLPVFYRCGCCECYHPAGFDGDCRDDSNRFAPDELDESYKPRGNWQADGWIEIDQDADREFLSATGPFMKDTR